MKHTISILILMSVLLGCSFDNKEKKDETTEPLAIAKFVDYEVRSINEMVGPCATDSLSTKCFIFQVEYPFINSGPLTEVINELNNNIKTDITNTYTVSDQPVSFQELKENLANDYKQMLTDFPDYQNSWALEINSDVLYQDSLFISVATTIYSYTGGAHPNSVQVYRSYDLRTGEQITLDKLLIEGYESSLNEYAEIEFRMTNEIPPNESLEERGYRFEEGQFSLTQNFAIINKSLVFYFNPYEIASYAMGATELELKLTDYVDLIKEGSVIYAYKTQIQ